MSGPYPEYPDSGVFSPPGEHTPNNDRAFVIDKRSMVGIDNRRAYGEVGVGNSQQEAISGTTSRGYARGMGGIRRGAISREGQREGQNYNVRHRSSSSSGIMSPPIAPVTEEDPPSESG